MQQDPIGIRGDKANLGNGYSYVGNNPVNRTDALGLRPVYGHYCGSGQDPGKPMPISAIDGCCAVHDLCFKEKGLSAYSGWVSSDGWAPTGKFGSCNLNVILCFLGALAGGIAAPAPQFIMPTLMSDHPVAIRYNTIDRLPITRITVVQFYSPEIKQYNCWSRGYSL